MNRPFAIGDRTIGSGRCFVIAEVAQSHDGSLGVAHAFVDAVADAGADAVKFQTHIAEAESSPDEPFRVPFSTQDATRFDYWRRTGFTSNQWKEIAAHARDRGLVFLSSPFSPEAVDVLIGAGVPAWKLASGTLEDLPTLDRMLATRLPLLISTGLSGWADIDRIVARARDAGAPFVLCQTTTMYPCPPERVGLNVLGEFRQRYDCHVGLSDHSGAIVPCIAAAASGAALVEVHVCFSRSMFGPDVPASVTFEELGELVRAIRMLEVMAAHPVDKDAAAREAAPLRQIFGKRLVAAVPLKTGTVLERPHLAARKPAGAFRPDQMDAVLGRRLRRDLEPGEPLEPADLSDAEAKR